MPIVIDDPFALLLATFVAAAAGVLVWAGIAKVAQPRPISVAIYRLAGGPVAVGQRRIESLIATTLGVAEILIGLATIVFGGPELTAIVAIAFVAFAAVTARLIRVAPDVPCGCFGAGGPGPTARHVWLNVLAAAIVGAAAAVSISGTSKATASIIDHVDGYGTAAISAIGAVALAWLWHRAVNRSTS